MKKSKKPLNDYSLSELQEFKQNMIVNKPVDPDSLWRDTVERIDYFISKKEASVNVIKTGRSKFNEPLLPVVDPVDAVDLRSLVRVAVAGRQGKVADAVGIRRATISEYLNGKSSMSADTVEAILNFKSEIK